MLSDRIEKFILELLGQQPSEEVLLKRKDVAELLECAPSQVTYVINTRFSSNNRFIVESRRGNGGYIKIAVRTVGKGSGELHPKTAASDIYRREESVPPKEAERNPYEVREIEAGLNGYYKMLFDYEMISEREYRLMCMMTHTMLEFCPEPQRKSAAKALIHRIEWVLKEE